MKDKKITIVSLVEKSSLYQYIWGTTSRQFMMDKEIINVILVEAHQDSPWRAKNYKCDSCGKSFTSAGYLKMHINVVHEGHRNHKCDSCGNSFTQSGPLKNHIKTIHDRQRNYNCDSCGKSFSKSGHL